MGRKSSASSGKVRKDNDKVDLKPLSRSGGGGNGGGTSQGGSAPTCPTGFEVALPEAAQLVEGMSLSLRVQDEVWHVIAGGKAITQLAKSQSAMLSRCQEVVYHYSGRVKVKSKRKYGEFQRSAA